MNNHIGKLEKGMHLPGAQVLKPVHLATKTCTPGARCTLNFHTKGQNWVVPTLNTQNSENKQFFITFFS